MVSILIHFHATHIIKIYTIKHGAYFIRFSVETILASLVTGKEKLSNYQCPLLRLHAVVLALRTPFTNMEERCSQPG